MTSTGNSVIEADLLGHKVFIDSESAQIGGSWQGRNNSGVPCVWDPPVIQFFLDKCSEATDPFILDIGANTGTFSMLPIINPAIRGIAFEPNPHVYKLLKTNLKLNSIDHKISTIPLALSNEVGRVCLKIPDSGMHSGLACIGTPLRFGRWKEVAVPTDSLDNVISRKKINKLDLIKIDTEGCELFVLRGGEQTLRKYKPKILIEYFAMNTAQFGYEPEELRTFLEGLGYKFSLIGDDDAFFEM